MNGKLAELIKNWWFLVIFIAGTGAWGANVKANMEFMVHEMDEQRIMIEKLVDSQGELTESYARFMSGTSQWMRLHAEHHKSIERR